MHGRVSSEARNGTLLRKKLVSLNSQNNLHRIESVFTWEKISKVCSYFCSTEPNSELFSFPRNDPERNSESLVLFLFHITEFRAFFSSAGWFGMEFREFASIFSRGTEFRAFFSIPNPNPVFVSVTLVPDGRCQSSIKLFSYRILQF